MTNPLDPYNWGDYPSLAELAPDMCGQCKAGNEMPRSRNCYSHATDAEKVAIDAFYASEPTREEQIQAAVDAEDSRLADADWGTET